RRGSRARVWTRPRRAGAPWQFCAEWPRTGASARTPRSSSSTPAAARRIVPDMPIAILHPFSGISGDMTLGALVSLGLDPEWLRGLSGRLGISDVTTEIKDVKRAGIACTKVDFQIPP